LSIIHDTQKAYLFRRRIHKPRGQKKLTVFGRALNRYGLDCIYNKYTTACQRMQYFFGEGEKIPQQLMKNKISTENNNLFRRGEEDSPRIQDLNPGC